MTLAPPQGLEGTLNTVVNGDCVDLMRSLPPGSAQMVFADPPFNLNKKYRTYEDNLEFGDYLRWTETWVDAALDALSDDGTLFIYNIPKLLTYTANILNERAEFRHWIAWNSGGKPLGKTLQPSHYGILFYTKNKQSKFYDVRAPHKSCRKCSAYLKDYGGKEHLRHPFGYQIGDVWDDIHRVRHASKRIDNHPCQLPVHLVERLILMTTDPDDIVLDPFCGGGSAAVAARQLGRNYIGAEIDPHYQEVAQSKLDDALPTTVFGGGGGGYIRIVSPRSDCLDSRHRYRGRLAVTGPNKLTFKQLQDGMETFLVFPDIEEEMKAEKRSRIRAANQSASAVLEDSTELDSIIRALQADSTNEYQAKLTQLLATCPGSLEGLDRVCAVVCPSERSWFQRWKSERATSVIASFLHNPSEFEDVPWFIAEGFRLPERWMDMLRQNLASGIHNSMRSLYSTKIGLALEADIASVVEGAGYAWEKGAVKLVDDKEVDLAVETLTLPRILIMSSYNLTTSSGQSERARAQEKMYKEIRTYNDLRDQSDVPDVQLVNIIDGGGWIARSSDLHWLHKHCDYAFARSQLDQLVDVLHYHMKQK